MKKHTRQKKRLRATGTIEMVKDREKVEPQENKAMRQMELIKHHRKMYIKFQKLI